MHAFFNMQYNLTKFGTFVRKWIVTNAMWLIFELQSN